MCCTAQLHSILYEFKCSVLYSYTVYCMNSVHCTVQYTVLYCTLYYTVHCTVMYTIEYFTHNCTLSSCMNSNGGRNDCTAQNGTKLLHAAAHCTTQCTVNSNVQCSEVYTARCTRLCTVQCSPFPSYCPYLAGMVLGGDRKEGE